MGQLGRGHESGVRDLHLVVRLVALLEPAQDGHGVLHRGLSHVDLLETTLQGGVLLDVLAVLVQRGGADQAQLAAGQHGLEHVARVHGALGRTRAHHGVDLVDERDDLTLGLLDLVQDGLQSLLELAAVLRAGHHGPEVQGDQRLPAQGLGDVPCDHALREAFHHGGLAHAGLADQHGIVLGAPGEHLDHAADLRVAADHRVELALTRNGGEVRAELLQGLKGPLRVRAGDAAVTADLRNGLGERLGGDTGVLQSLRGLVVARGQAVKDVLRGDVLVLQLARIGLGGLQRLQRGAAQLGLGRGAAGRARQLVDDGAGLEGHGIGVGAGGLQDRDRHTVPLVHEGLEGVGGLDVGVARGRGVRRRRTQGLLRLGGELGVHSISFCLANGLSIILSLVHSTCFVKPSAPEFWGNSGVGRL